MLIGNDIVWLQDPRNKGRSSDLRLTARILTARERLMVQVSSEPDRMLWSLWAAKEAAFKAVSRDSPATVFAPVRFEVNPETPGTNASVVFKTRRLPVKWLQGPDWVHAAVAEKPDAAQVCVERRSGSEEEGRAVRALAAAALNRTGVSGTVWGRPPVFRLANGGEIPLSLSHDGPYLAVVFFLPGL